LFGHSTIHARVSAEGLWDAAASVQMRGTGSVSDAPKWIAWLVTRRYCILSLNRRVSGIRW